MICTRCRRILDHDAPRCECGFAFVAAPEELDDWFDEVRRILETAYLAAPTPWQQSGKSGTFEDWARLRIPIAECVDRPGTFLDIGCANGFLLECLLDWTLRKGIAIDPFGLDYSAQVAQLARQRLPQFAHHIFTGNAWDWRPPRRFDFVRTEAVYVPRNLQRAFLTRLLADVVAPGGYLLVADYRSRSEDIAHGWLDEELPSWGFSVERVTHGFNGAGRELTRVARLAKP